MYVIGIDIGGTFTDAALVDTANGAIYQFKSATTPRDPKIGVLDTLRLAAEHLEVPVSDILAQTSKFVHSTTLTTNAIFNRSGSRVGLIATQGFGDTMMIMRSKGRVAGTNLLARRHLRVSEKPAPIVPRWCIAEVAERIDSSGQVVTILEPAAVLRAAQTLKENGVEAVAVALLWSFKNPAHELQVRDILRKVMPGIPIHLSHEIAPVIGEYERTATAVLDAYVGPILRKYLDELEGHLRGVGLRQPLLIAQANGGASYAEEIRAVETIESGPSAGIVGTQLLAELLGHRKVIASDIGGTTAKSGLLVDGAWEFAHETVIAQFSLNIPAIDVASIGAGGGSIAWVEGKQRLRVGPVSAGADPGPACYGLGGTEPTVTDADVLLGYIDPEYFLGGAIRLQRSLAESAMRVRIADPLFGGDITAAAAAVRAITDAQVADLVRISTIERGHDPRDFVLYSYGGAGPTHCVSFGKQVGVRKILVPSQATVLCAMGAAQADIHHSLKLSDPLRCPPNVERVRANFERLERNGAELLQRQKVVPEEMRFQYWVEMRYRRQAHTIRIPFKSERFTEAALLEAIDRFDQRYEDLYGRGAANKEAGKEILTYGLEAIGLTVKPVPVAYPLERRDPSSAASKGWRKAYWPERREFVDTPIYHGVLLRPGNHVQGPAILEFPATTFVLNPGANAQVDSHLNVVVDLEANQGE